MSVARTVISVAVLTLMGGLVAHHTESASALAPCAGLAVSSTDPASDIRTLDCYEPDPTTLKPLSNSQIKQLNSMPDDVHDIKDEMKAGTNVDLYMDPKTGAVYAMDKSRLGVPEYTGVFFPRGGGGPEEGSLPEVPDAPDLPDLPDV